MQIFFTIGSVVLFYLGGLSMLLAPFAGGCINIAGIALTVIIFVAAVVAMIVSERKLLVAIAIAPFVLGFVIFLSKLRLGIALIWADSSFCMF